MRPWRIHYLVSRTVLWRNDWQHKRITFCTKRLLAILIPWVTSPSGHVCSCSASAIESTKSLFSRLCSISVLALRDTASLTTWFYPYTTRVYTVRSVRTTQTVPVQLRQKWFFVRDDVHINCLLLLNHRLWQNSTTATRTLVSSKQKSIFKFRHDDQSNLTTA